MASFEKPKLNRKEEISNKNVPKRSDLISLSVNIKLTPVVNTIVSIHSIGHV